MNDFLCVSHSLLREKFERGFSAAGWWEKESEGKFREKMGKFSMKENVFKENKYKIAYILGAFL